MVLVENDYSCRVFGSAERIFLFFFCTRKAIACPAGEVSLSRAVRAFRCEPGVDQIGRPAESISSERCQNTKPREKKYIMRPTAQGE